MAPGIGRSLKTQLTTTFWANVVSAAGIFTGFVSPGSLFDPTGSIATLQPAGFDQLAAMFARYLVTGATVHMEVAQGALGAAAASITSFVVAGYPSTVSTALATFQGAASQPYAKTALGVVGGDAVKLSWKLNTQKIVGSRLPVIAEDCGALVGASPTTGQSIVLPFFIESNANATTTFVVKFTIVHDCIFDQRIQNVDA